MFQKRRSSRWSIPLPVPCFVFCLLIFGFSETLLNAAGSDRKTNSVPLSESFFKTYNLTLLKSVNIDGDWGYLTEFQDLKNSSIQPKYCLVLTGKPYSLGYQASYLLPSQAHQMLSRYMKIVGLAQLQMLGLKVDPDSPEGEYIYELLYDTLLEIARKSEEGIPKYIREEFRGVSAGLAAAGIDSVSYDDVMLLNQGIDSTYYYIWALSGKIPSPENIAIARGGTKKLVKALVEMGRKEDARELLASLKTFTYTPLRSKEMLDFGCNEFVVSGEATQSGDTIHGRDFMFSTAGIYENATSLIVYLPDSGKPFVTVAPPGFVGQTVGLNLDGLSIGQDICQADAYGSQLGMGSMLVIRHLLQQSGGLKEAAESFTSLARGVPWIYALADDTDDPDFGSGMVLEAGASDTPFDGPDTLPRWQQRLLKRYIRKLPNELPDRGLMVRGAKWQYPKEFENKGIVLKRPSPYFPDLPYWPIGFTFPSQQENNENILVATNHFIIPQMRFTQFELIVQFMYNLLGESGNSLWRYDSIINLIKQHYGKIHFFGSDLEIPEEGSAGWIVDFLNPKRCDYYGTNLHTPVPGHHVIINNSTKDFQGLYGYMSDPWVGLNLKRFVEDYQKQ